MGQTVGAKSRQKLKDFVSWFEIPVYDIYRAAQFYNAIYHMDMDVSVNGEFAMAFFPADSGIGGALVAGPGCTPNATGVLIYLNAGNQLDHVLARVESSGGRVIMPRTLINEEAGAFALFIDSEGNRLALHEGAPPEVASMVTTETVPSVGKTAAAPRRAAKGRVTRVRKPGAKKKPRSVLAAKVAKVAKVSNKAVTKKTKGTARKR